MENSNETDCLNIILTGANAGIGLDCALSLCKSGHDVTISVRSLEKGEATIATIKEAVPTAKIAYIVMEMADFQSIRRFVDAFRTTGKRLDVLINNAGMFPAYSSTERTTVDGNPEFERAMAVNCMGSFLLTQLLLEDLKKAGRERGDKGPARIVNVSSSVTTMVKNPEQKYPFYIDDLMLKEENHYVSGMQAYRNSKIAMNLWANELAKQLAAENAPVIINSLCPGFIPSTNLSRELTGVMGFLFRNVMDSFIGRMFMKTVPINEGTKRIYYVLFNVKDSGKFYQKDVSVDECPEVQNPEYQKKIWDLCVKYTEL